MSEQIEVKKAVIDSKTIENFLFSSETKLNEKQKTMFLQLAIRNQLDPFKREIYAIPYGNDFNIVTGYQVYIQRAETTGKLNGWHCEATKNDKGELIGAKIVIYRKDFDNPFEWEISLKEFDKGQSSWKKMPEFMIKKVCIGQGFRLAFPNELGGLPYLQEELEDLPNISESKNESITSQYEPKVTKPSIKDPSSQATEKQVGMIHKICDARDFSYDALKGMLKVEHMNQITKGTAGKLIEFLQKIDEFNSDMVLGLVGEDYLYKGG